MIYWFLAQKLKVLANTGVVMTPKLRHAARRLLLLRGHYPARPTHPGGAGLAPLWAPPLLAGLAAAGGTAASAADAAGVSCAPGDVAWRGRLRVASAVIWRAQAASAGSGHV